MDTISNKLRLDALEIYRGRLSSCLRKSPEEFVLLSHFGNVDDSKVNALINVIEQSILENGIKRKIMKRVCSIMIELLQNISIHGATDKKGNTNAGLIITKSSDQVKVICGNLIHNEDVGIVDYKLDQINKLTQDELRKLYIETLCNENFSLKGGAGLGFLTIAKKVILPIKFDILEVDENTSYFTSEFRISTIVE